MESSIIILLSEYDPGILFFVRFVFFIIFLISCGSENQEIRYLPETLPTEESIKRSISSDEYLPILRAHASNKGSSLEKWKELEKTAITESEITRYWKMERKGFPSDSFDTDAIDKGREAIRTRLAWSRIFKKAQLPLKEAVGPSAKKLISKLNLTLSPTIGKPNAKWTIIEWSDYHCTFCKKTHPFTKRILERYKGQILYYHKDFPLDPDTIEGTTLLAVSRCLWEKEPSHYMSNADMLYNQTRIEGNKEYGGLEICRPNRLAKEYYNLVNEDYREAIGVGIGSIPTFWVNGHFVVGSLDEKSWARLLRDTALE